MAHTSDVVDAQQQKGISESVITIIKIADKYYVWSADDVYKLRTLHKICGSLVGSLPRKPWQTNANALPLILMPEEAHLCELKQFGKIVASEDYFKACRVFNKEHVDAFKKQRDKTEIEQMKIFKAKKKAKESIFYGYDKKANRRKIKKQLDKEDKDQKGLEVSNVKMHTRGEHTAPHQERSEEQKARSIDELRTVASNDILPSLNENDLKYYKQGVRVHIPTSFNTVSLTCYHSNYPNTNKDKTYFTVFQDLWLKSYYITSAEKFGGDYLVYPGDPLRYHSFFIVVVMDKNKELSSKQLICYGRLAASVKKTIVMATVKDDFSGVSYLSLGWTHMKSC